MGSLSLATTIGGAGRGITDTVKMQNENKQRDLDREHRERLRQMADEAAMERTNRTGEIQGALYGAERADQLADREDEREYNLQVAATSRAAEIADREDEQAHELSVEDRKGENQYNLKLMDMYDKYTKTNSRTTKDGKWEMKVLTKTEMGANGLPIEVDTFVVRQPGTPFSLEQHGLYMLPHNYSPEEMEATLTKANNMDNVGQSDMSALLDRAGTEEDVSSEFLKVYGFLPMDYFRKVSDGATKKTFSEFKKSIENSEPEQKSGTLTQARSTLMNARPVPVSMQPESLQPASIGP